MLGDQIELEKKISQQVQLQWEQKSLNRCSCNGTKPYLEEKCGDLSPNHNLGAAKNMSLFMECVYTHGGYLMVKMTPSPDVEDYDNEVPT